MRVADDILAILSVIQCEGHRARIAVRLEPQIYRRVDAVLKQAGGTWNRRAEAHLFPGPAAEAIEAILLTGTVSSVRQQLGQFDSPSDVADRAVALARLEPGLRVLEPSAGSGNLVVRALRAGCRVTAYEIDRRRNATLVGRVRDLPGPLEFQGDFICGDFLTSHLAPDFDRVVMNPPFAHGQEISHVLYAVRCLRPGGRLVAVMSRGIRYRQDSAYVIFRHHLDQLGATIEDLPDDAFRSSGTAVKACIVAFDRSEAAAERTAEAA